MQRGLQPLKGEWSIATRECNGALDWRGFIRGTKLIQLYSVVLFFLFVVPFKPRAGSEFAV